MKKNVYLHICSVVLFAILLLCFFKTDIYIVNKYPLEFSVEQGTCNTEISIYESDNGTCYVFLPSYAKLATLKIVMPTDLEASLGGTTITNGMNCEDFELETAYSLIIDNQYIAELQFLQSANVATIYVDTLSGSRDRIHKDKAYSEQASVMLYTADGILNASDSAAYIKGRGNATWYYDKRPYILTFSSDADLLGMGAATKWILLANAADATNLNNKLIMDLARQTVRGWSPDCKYVDLYLNGEYSGLYLLIEKVEPGTARLNINPQTDDFLCKVDLEDRWHSLKNPIKTQAGRTIEICSPDPLTNLSTANIVSAINQMEQIIMSDTDLTKVKHFDLDSWVQRYLIDEISGNIDSDLVSSYFYSSDGVFYAGPVWDYDMTFGNCSRNICPTAFIAKNTYKSDRSLSLYYSALYANESFYNRMVECYQSEFLPLLNQLIDEGIFDLATEIQAAARMDLLRNHSGNESVSTVDGLITYLKTRVSFLNSVWIEGTEYCTLQFQYANENAYRNISVKKGNLLVTDYLDVKTTVWVDKETGNVVDFSQPILSDMILMQQLDPNVYGKSMDTNSLKAYVIVLSSIVLLLFFFCLVYVDILQRRKERSASNEPKETRISP